jgi:transposase-like protein
MEQVPRRVYTQEFRKQAVKLVEVEDLSSREAAQPAGVNSYPATRLRRSVSIVEESVQRSIKR